MSALEAELAMHIRAAKLPEPEREYRFDGKRRWRFDFAWPTQLVAVEVEGGIWNGGRHVTGKGFTADTEKYNAAVVAGWRVLRFTGTAIKAGTALATIEAVLSRETGGMEVLA
jgi:very-short-patch-repair endonuclease